MFKLFKLITWMLLALVTSIAIFNYNISRSYADTPTIPVGANPFGVAVNPNTNTTYEVTHKK